TCVECLPSNDTCGIGTFCSPETKGCANGCKGDSDCASPLVCDQGTHECKGCTSDLQCAAGTVCSPDGACKAGCNDSQPCGSGFTCCTGACVDLNNDVKACGA